MLALLAVWRVCMDYGISPRVMGHELEIHPLLAIFAVMVGGAVGESSVSTFLFRWLPPCAFSGADFPS
jgi:hypothetical protein